jgi:uncharacterized protein VirK/YbjX
MGKPWSSAQAFLRQSIFIATALARYSSLCMLIERHFCMENIPPSCRLIHLGYDDNHVTASNTSTLLIHRVNSIQ